MTNTAPENQWLVVGPPGVGKTTYTARQAERAAQKYGSDKVMLVSFTRAAAAEMASRKTPLNRDMIGTLHSFAFRSLGMPKITESLVKEWNASHHGPYQLSDSLNRDEPEAGGATDGDKTFGQIQLARARMIDDRLWTPEMRAFWKVWCEFKKETDSLDFTDLIGIAARDVVVAPGNPTVMMCDEAQDLSKLEFSLIKHWSKNMDFFFIVGDSDQSIFSFRGSDPNIFLDPPTPEEHTRVLQQSYRVPRQIHALAVNWIRRLSKRFPSVYLPRDYEGEILAPSAVTFKDPQRVLDHANYFLEQKDDDGNPKKLMFLGACGYHVEPLVREMRRQGIPFHNPYRRSHGGWNPLRTSSKGTSTTDRIRAFLAGLEGPNGNLWTADELQKWIGLVKVDGVLQRGAKTAISKIEGDAPLRPQELRRFFRDDAFNAACAGDIRWLRQNLTGQYQNAASFALAIVERQGVRGLTDTPQITVGTIHCSPGDEQVLTPLGWRAISQLDPEWDTLGSYDSNCNRLTWGRKGKRGIPFIMAKNPYHGTLITLETSASKTRVTPEHRVRVRYAQNFCEKWIVYLMRRGEWWRVGLCTSGHLPFISGGLGGRLSTEQADAGWILGVYESRTNALMNEARIQQYYGMPSLTFEVAKNRALTTKEVQAVHEWTKDVVQIRAMQVLQDHGLLLDYPLYKRDNTTRLGYWFDTVAANVLDGYMELPITDDFKSASNGIYTSPEARLVTVRNEQYIGDVYSLQLARYNYYVSGGAVVHNSVKGGESHIVYVDPSMSSSMAREWYDQSITRRDSIIRQFYVAITRASETLVLCRGDNIAVPIPTSAPKMMEEEF